MVDWEWKKDKEGKRVKGRERTCNKCKEKKTERRKRKN